MSSSAAGRLYRIISFDRAVQIFESESLHFAHPSSWEDPYEVRLRHNASHSFFGQCWCTRGVSDAMWRIYSTAHLGVRISTSTRKLKEALAAETKAMGGTLRLGNVKYLSQYNLNLEMQEIHSDLQQSFTTKRAMDALFLKREAFDHEAEYRAVLHIPNASPKVLRNGVKIKVSPHKLIDSILLDPRAPKELAAALSFYFTDKLNFTQRVATSVLYKSQTPLIVEEE